jgi:hypothetical protein
VPGVIRQADVRIGKGTARRGTIMPHFSNLIADLKQVRDEIGLKIHLGSRELQDEWSALDRRWTEFERKADLTRSTRDVGDAVKLLGLELKDAFSRIKQAL